MIKQFPGFRHTIPILSTTHRIPAPRRLQGVGLALPQQATAPATFGSAANLDSWRWVVRDSAVFLFLKALCTCPTQTKHAADT